jgi:hypothetical protein
MDGAAKKASDEAMWKKNNWKIMTWEEKKKAFEERGLYRQTPGEVTAIDSPDVVEQQMVDTPLTALLEWTPEGNISAEQAAVVKPKPEAKKRKKKTTTSTQVKKARETTGKAEAEVAALKKQLERATCNG